MSLWIVLISNTYVLLVTAFLIPILSFVLILTQKKQRLIIVAKLLTLIPIYSNTYANSNPGAKLIEIVIMFTIFI